MRTRAKLALAFVLLLVAAVPAFAATTPTGKTADQIRAYYDSGAWNRAVKKQATKAKAYLDQAHPRQARRQETRARARHRRDQPRQLPVPQPKRRHPVQLRFPTPSASRPTTRPRSSRFGRCSGWAKDLKVKVFFITGRPEAIRGGTLQNLKAAGYRGRYELILQPAGVQRLVDGPLQERALASRSRSAASRSSPTSATSRATSRAGTRSAHTNCRTPSTSPSRASAALALGAPAGAARARAGAHRAGGVRALRPAGRGVGARRGRRATPRSSSPRSRTASTCGSLGWRAARSASAAPSRPRRTWSRCSGSRAAWSSTSPPPTATTRAHPMRPAELLALQGIYDTPAEARAALDGMGKLMAQAMVEKALARATARPPPPTPGQVPGQAHWRAATPGATSR